MFYNSDDRIDASAYFHSPYYIIEIDWGVIVDLFKRFYIADKLFDHPVLNPYHDLVIRFGQAPGLMIFQDICLMFFYHEVAHLVQNSVENNGFYSEYMTHICVGDEVPTHHIRELNADWFSAWHLAHHILEASEREPNGVHVAPAEFEIFAAQMLFAVYLYFITNCEGVDMYFKRKCHPQPAVRVAFFPFKILETQETLLPVL